jgi:preprotein translocase subunit SecD
MGVACSHSLRSPATTWQLVLEVEAPPIHREALAQQTASVIEERLNAFGVSNFQVRPQGGPMNGRIVVSLPEVPDRERLKQVILEEGRLELTAVISPPSPVVVRTYKTKQEALASIGERVPGTARVLPYSERAKEATSDPMGNAGQEPMQWVVVESPAIVSGSDLRTTSAISLGRSSGDYQIAFTLKPEGAEKFGAWTGGHINSYIGVVLNGEVRWIAYIKSPITDRGEINGRFTRQSAEDLTLVLRSGALPVPVRMVEVSANR